MGVHLKLVRSRLISDPLASDDRCLSSGAKGEGAGGNVIREDILIKGTVDVDRRLHERGGDSTGDRGDPRFAYMGPKLIP